MLRGHDETLGRALDEERRAIGTRDRSPDTNRYLEDRFYLARGGERVSELDEGLTLLDRLVSTPIRRAIRRKARDVLSEALDESSLRVRETPRLLDGVHRERESLVLGSLDGHEDERARPSRERAELRVLLRAEVERRELRREVAIVDESTRKTQRLRERSEPVRDELRPDAIRPVLVAPVDDDPGQRRARGRAPRRLWPRGPPCPPRC